MKLAQAHIGHVPQLAKILWAFTRQTEWLPQRRTRLTDLWLMLRITAKGWVTLMHDGQRPVGFIARDGARIHALFVLPKARGNGVGCALLEDAKRTQDQLELWVLKANRLAVKFYTDQGFNEVGRSHGAGNDENLPDIRMAWQVSTENWRTG